MSDLVIKFDEVKSVNPDQIKTYIAQARQVLNTARTVASMTGVAMAVTVIDKIIAILDKAEPIITQPWVSEAISFVLTLIQSSPKAMQFMHAIAA